VFVSQILFIVIKSGKYNVYLLFLSADEFIAP